MPFLFLYSLEMLVAHLCHDLTGLLIIKLVFSVETGFVSFLFLSLLCLLHDNLITHRLL